MELNVGKYEAQRSNDEMFISHITGGGGGGGYSGFQVTGDDRRIILGLKFLIPGFWG